MCYSKMWLKKELNQRKSSGKFVNCVVVIFFLVLFNFFTAASRPGCSIALGLENKKIRDSQLTSDSHATRYDAENARLNNNGAWCSDNNKSWKEYLQIRLDRVQHISGIASQGYKIRFLSSYWVKQYTIKYSYDGTVWYWYKDNSHMIKEFDANTDANSVKRIKLRDTFVAKYLRIYPTSFKKDMCMRLELYGCPDKIDYTYMLTAASGVISTPNYPSPYPTGIDSTWIIKLSHKNKRITAFFNYFDVNNGTSSGCQDDFVQALNGIVDISPSLGRVCNGVQLPLLKSPSNEMRIHFHSESNSVVRKGFQLSYYSGDVSRATECTGSTLNLDCSSSGKSIKILHAFYGSLPFTSTCGSQASGSPCISADSQQIITTKCEHYKVCQVDVTRSLFSVMSCQSGQVPQLDVYYQCTGTLIKTLPPSTLAPSTTTPPPTTYHTILPATVSSQSSLPTTTTPAVTSTKTGVRFTSTPTVSATQGEGGNTLARVDEKDKTGLLIGVVVAIIIIIIIVVVVVLVCFYKRRRKQKEKPMAGVTYTAPNNSFDMRPSNNGHGTSQTNPYETVNVLYVSADEPRSYRDEDSEHIYDSPELQEPLPKMTNNPLYHAFEVQPSPNYESIDKDKPPPSLDPAIYDSPLPVSNPKSATLTSISNPNYGKGTEIIPDK